MTNKNELLGGPTATVHLSHYTVALHSVALYFSGLGGVSAAGESRYTPQRAL